MRVSSLSIALPPSPCLQTSAFHPRYHTIDAIPLSVKSPCSLHPNSRSTIHRSPIPHRPTSKSSKDRCSTSHAFPAAPCRPPLSLDFTCVWFGRMYAAVSQAFMSSASFLILYDREKTNFGARSRTIAIGSWVPPTKLKNEGYAEFRTYVYVHERDLLRTTKRRHPKWTTYPFTSDSIPSPELCLNAHVTQL